jgi:signal recognition particle receptor subunit beta
MEIFKIAVTRNVDAGKTTFIRTISKIKIVDTERRATDETASLKANTTVAFDQKNSKFKIQNSKFLRVQAPTNCLNE